MSAIDCGSEWFDRTAMAAVRRRVVDQWTVAKHPDAGLGGGLAWVVTLLVGSASWNLIELSLAPATPGPIAAVHAATALTGFATAALAIAGNRLFPATYCTFAGLSALIVALAVAGLPAGSNPLSSVLAPSAVAAGLLLLAVPYVIGSRRCRLIFRHEVDPRDLRRLTPAAGPAARPPVWRASTAKAPDSTPLPSPASPVVAEPEPARPSPRCRRPQPARTGGPIAARFDASPDVRRFLEPRPQEPVRERVELVDHAPTIAAQRRGLEALVNLPAAAV